MSEAVQVDPHLWSLAMMTADVAASESAETVRAAVEAEYTKLVARAKTNDVRILRAVAKVVSFLMALEASDDEILDYCTRLVTDGQMGPRRRVFTLVPKSIRAYIERYRQREALCVSPEQRAIQTPRYLPVDDEPAWYAGPFSTSIDACRAHRQWLYAIAAQEERAYWKAQLEDPFCAKRTRAQSLIDTLNRLDREYEERRAELCAEINSLV